VGGALEYAFQALVVPFDHQRLKPPVAVARASGVIDSKGCFMAFSVVTQTPCRANSLFARATQAARRHVQPAHDEAEPRDSVGDIERQFASQRRKVAPANNPRQGPTMKFAVGLVCVAACATKQGPEPATAKRTDPATVEPANSNTAPALTPAVVLSTIKSRYIGGVERCYRRHLKNDATARGRVFVSFTVDPQGQAREGAARGITERVDECIAAQVARWQFPAPQQEARFALGLELGTD
jgi:hypothetical protein